LSTGASPYAYQWFSEAPGSLSYVFIDNATASSYNFTTTKATATGNWSFKLEVTDATGAVVNSTASAVTVNAPATNAFWFSAAAVILVVVVIAVILCAVAFALKKSHRANSESKQTRT